ncbi:hypothetical protein K5V21_01180 [Clostridium sardiniense]|uniref:VanZ-like domain-containing protein n=1 Tax=Clostridium sardiniense TaxID=29369 RepID=A0ABS7KTW7_CLOSR|nr:hypothetical protein [Clostridium sardiniense]MBY0754057.1 hypothetical protein [Clostridium sardiniense]MDQ0459423.1 hypothetical protein [Clostridium sardiniense]
MKKKSFILILTCILILLLMDNIYRPYIYSRGIFDFFIADSFPSLMGPIILSAYMACTDTSIYKNKIDEILFIITPSIGLIIAEFISPIISRHVSFDIMDVVFAALGGVIVYFIKKNLYDKWYNTIKLAHTI